MISKEEKAKIRNEEIYRQEVRMELDAKNSESQPKKKYNALEVVGKIAEVSKSLILTFLLVALVFIGWRDILPKLKESFRRGEIDAIDIGILSIKMKQQIEKAMLEIDQIDVPITEVAGFESILEKGSTDFLEEVKSKLQRDELRTIDILLLIESKRYSGKILSEYIATLGTKFVVFGGLESFGWIDAAIFVAQLKAYETYSYLGLRTSILGIKDDFVTTDKTVKEVLKKMADLHYENIAVLDSDSNFRFIVNRGDLVSQLLSSVILAQEGK
ncbi:MAG: hypothetical protein ACFFDT_40450 [Candidatus Hodarchaeota archaeon]